jgi:hypothetical protein
MPEDHDSSEAVAVPPRRAEDAEWLKQASGASRMVVALYWSVEEGRRSAHKRGPNTYFTEHGLFSTTVDRASAIYPA